MSKSTCRFCNEGQPLITLGSGERVHELPEGGLFICFASRQPNTIPLVYILSPYTHHNPEVIEQRYDLVEHYEALLTYKFPDALFYSPIAHFHLIAIVHNLPRDVDYWRKKNRCMIHRSQLGIVLRIEGWIESEGITWERELFNTLHILYIKDDPHSEYEVVGQALQKLA